MHCDDKRTIFVLEQFILNSTFDLQKAINQLKTEKDEKMRIQIQARINSLERDIQDSKDQLLSLK